MDERLRFIARLLEGEKKAPLCREFGISRVTGYKTCGVAHPNLLLPFKGLGRASGANDDQQNNQR